MTDSSEDMTIPMPHDETGEVSQRKAWSVPVIEELPALTSLTLQTGAPVGGGQSVFP